ncbi:AAA family ATPase [Streptomyces fuscigenes]|uniref:AAA family ATPase n=1 Tax=Streptomyces fuscigenes TaxID=1528880 RepID=UPI001F175732|nr:AAA family ATPase [Streptomyces fuscigenes]MCF3964956.1 AAA family ATPase [Streptomyces fuscigenes]
MGEWIRPRGVVDLRVGGQVPAGAGEARAGSAAGGPDGPGPAGMVVLEYPPGAVVVVSGLPGSGKSTLLGRLAASGGGVRVVDPRAAHERWEARMPSRLPYAAYRPLARLAHLAGLCSAVRSGAPLLVHDCGSRAWMRRLLALAVRLRPRRPATEPGRPRPDAHRQARDAGVHLVLLDITPAEALRGQRARGRHVPRRTFGAHVRGLAALTEAIGARGRGAVRGTASVVLLDRATRSLLAGVAFGPPGPAGAPPRTPRPTCGDAAEKD